VTQVLPYGAWPSPIHAGLMVEQSVRLDQLQAHGDDLCWLEGRPEEAGRQVVVRLGAGDLLPAPLSARTLVHEYGGGDFTFAGGSLVFANFDDQRVYVGSRALTAALDGVRYADFDAHPDGSRVACVRERHPADGSEAINDLVTIALDDGAVTVVAEGHDFFAAPRWSPDGQLAWLAWDHPNMPWDGTTLYLDGAPVAGGRDVSISQPRWSPDGILHFVSDQTGWWNLYTLGSDAPLVAMEAEFTFPDWGFAFHTYDFLADGRIVAMWTQSGIDHLGVISAGELHEVPTSFTTFEAVVAWQGGVAALAGSPSAAEAVVRVDVATGETETLRRSNETDVDPRYVSLPRAVEFPTTGGRTAHALFYRPANPECAGPDDERPPLVVMSHGGPTAATASDLQLKIQYFTSRGIAVVDVNYGGSTGYGTEYRRRLDGQWGVVDVEDCANAARWLAEQGEVDGGRLAIRGGSAGGYTTLAVLTFRDDFATGASYYGVADAEALATDTHKFESRYLDRLIGPYPEARELYRARSPIHHVDQLRVPVILFQGLEDKVVPPAQAEVMVEALRSNGVPFAYLPFEGEQHGFRRAETIVRTLEAELWFYGRVLGFTPADAIAPVVVENDAGLVR
jgi:dipeptidyl aminopeptidase/acylaminoacyl peptidase